MLPSIVPARCATDVVSTRPLWCKTKSDGIGRPCSIPFTCALPPPDIGLRDQTARFCAPLGSVHFQPVLFHTHPHSMSASTFLWLSRPSPHHLSVKALEVALFRQHVISLVILHQRCGVSWCQDASLSLYGSVFRISAGFFTAEYNLVSPSNASASYGGGAVEGIVRSAKLMASISKSTMMYLDPSWTCGSAKLTRTR